MDVRQYYYESVARVFLHLWYSLGIIVDLDIIELNRPEVTSLPGTMILAVESDQFCVSQENV
jgi:hypothetical protein